MANWLHLAPSLIASFLASFVEFVEALTIILAVGVTRGWRSALLGSGLGVLALIVLVVCLGPLIGDIPIEDLQIAIGALLLLFGMRWLRKAILRSAGIVALHDEAATYAEETERLSHAGRRQSAWLDPVSIVTTFKAVLLEGLEVVFIVIAIGGTAGLLIPASAGAVLAGLIVVFLGLVLHRPLARVPENSLKFAVGILISTFGLFWLGEGFGFPWPGEDLAIPVLALLLLACGAMGISMAKMRFRAVSLERR